MDSALASYLLRRLLWVPPILFIVTFVTFTLARLGPGDPVSIATGQFRDPEVLERVRHAKGLDKPIHEQYYIYMKGLLTRGDLGESYRYKGRNVKDIIFPAMYRSAQYNAVALTITISCGIALGVFAARKQGTWSDPTAIGSALAIQSIPTMVGVPFLLLIFALKLGWVPASGWPRDCNVSLGFLGGNYDCIGVLSKEAIIPVIALALPAIAVWGRYTRAFTLEVMKEDYVRTARAKGISEFQVMTQHVLRNALLPLSTMIAFSLIGILEGSFILENLTGIPGVGRLAFESIGSRDYDLIMAITVVGATLFIMTSIFIDIAYTFIDPRIRYGSRSG
ncbi:MAG TPA: ABC transporter permease [Dehalococcoidia bacterium]|nr:ABC transporter permease [Dehalococcoidia bacterium]